ncbi:nitrite reductase small subunit NirD [Streptomyces sp. V3I7]|uniref:nitrite reductase small subunit NirD n=1 Tax=Streptomyces sp. V3I7 TaxID=3042278 RepID=UPI0027876996|nr:nitrite reductase small subunit NirD [Streptomyces sp. V3I7]MDQ0990796.1 nitrite reductase (NADH) small subunit [Streptomyces sp. V3I7]
MTTVAPETTKTTSVQVQLALEGQWFPVCELTALLPGRGVAALLPDGRQAALFHDRTGRLYAIDNRDPFTGAAVLSRGLTGTHRGRPYVASPLLKQRFDLADGRCLDDGTVRVATYGVRAAQAGSP